MPQRSLRALAPAVQPLDNASMSALYGAHRWLAAVLAGLSLAASASAEEVQPLSAELEGHPIRGLVAGPEGGRPVLLLHGAKFSPLTCVPTIRLPDPPGSTSTDSRPSEA